MKGWRPVRCPCGSGKFAAKCCRQPMGRFYKAPVELKTGTPSGYSNPGCYLSDTNNCCDAMSGEHLMSKNMLTRASKDQKTIKVGGHRWLKGQTKQVGIQGLVSKVLCRRHNSMLSPFDDAIGRIFDLAYSRLIDGDEQVRGLLVSGHDLERWAVQRFLANEYGEGASIDGVEIRASAAMRDAAKRALLEDHWDEGCGFYIAALPKDLGWAMESAVIIAMPQRDIIGIRITLAGQAFGVLWHKPPGFDDFQLFDYRPRNVLMRANGRDVEMIISWRDGTVIGGPGRTQYVVGRPPKPQT